MMKLTVTSSPHIRGTDTTSRIMRDVVISLLPAAIAGCLIYGLRAAFVLLVGMISALVGEWLWLKLTRQKGALTNGSAAVTGLLLAMTLPVSVPYWVIAVGSLFAVIVVKGLCGGLGQNVFNPALGARAFLLLMWPVYVTHYPEFKSALDAIATSTTDAVASSTVAATDAMSSATPLHQMQMLALPNVSLWDMVIGNIGGSIGEVCTLALLAGGAYLIFRRVISPRIPVAYLGSVAVLTLIFSHGDDPVMWMLYSLCGGGVMLGAIFMATDYVTSPVSPVGQIVYGVGCGILTVFFRYTGLFPEGVTYAILLMNAAVWLIDQVFVPRRFGVKKGEA